MSKGYKLRKYIVVVDNKDGWWTPGCTERIERVVTVSAPSATRPTGSTLSFVVRSSWSTHT